MFGVVEAFALTVALLAVFGGVLYWAARNAITICVIEVERGKLRVKRGGIAPRVLADIGDVVRRPRVKRATIRIVRERGFARLHMSGDLGDAQMQQLRNVVGSVPLAKLVNARRRDTKRK
jgi:HAMP domain-containing protein